MKVLISLAALLASSSAFAFTTGSYVCGRTTYTIAKSADGLPLMTIEGFNNTTYKGLGSIAESKNEAGQTVERASFSLGSATMQILFIDGVAHCNH